MVSSSSAQMRLYGASCFDSPILLHGWGRDKVWDLGVGTEWGKFGSLLTTSGERFFCSDVYTPDLSYELLFNYNPQHK